MKLTPIQIIGIIIVVNGALIGSTAQLTDLLGPLIAKDIVSVASIGNSIFGGIIMMLSGQGSMVKSVLAMPGIEHIDVNSQASAALATLAVDKSINKIAPTEDAMDKVVATAKAAAVILFAFIIAALTVVQPASAATKVRTAKPAVCDPLNLIPGCKPASGSATATSMPSLADGVQNLMNELQAANGAFVSNVVAAINEADADAGAIVVPATATTPAQVKDPISHACYPAQVQYLNSLPIAQKITVPAPYDVIPLFQFKRDFVNMVLAGQLIPAYLKVGCAALLGNEAAILIATLGIVGVGATTLGPITAFAGTLGTAAISLPAIAAIIPK